MTDTPVPAKFKVVLEFDVVAYDYLEAACKVKHDRLRLGMQPGGALVMQVTGESNQHTCVVRL